MSIFDANILHGAPPNLSARPRRGLSLRYLGSDVVFDNNKYGEQTSMAPFDCYDESLSNGDRVAGFVYPQVLPDKIPAEVERRLSGPIAPSKEKWNGGCSATRLHRRRRPRNSNNRRGIVPSRRYCIRSSRNTGRDLKSTLQTEASSYRPMSSMNSLSSHTMFQPTRTVS